MIADYRNSDPPKNDRSIIRLKLVDLSTVRFILDHRPIVAEREVGHVMFDPPPSPPPTHTPPGLSGDGKPTVPK